MHLAFLLLGLFALVLLLSTVLFNAGVYYFDRREQREALAYMQTTGKRDAP